MFQPRGFLSVLSSRILREALLLLLLSLLLLFPMRGEAQATPLTQGQWARYSMSGDMAGDVVNSTFTVLSLAHNLLTIQQVDLSSDCTPLAETHSLNLTTGRGSIEPGFYFAILPGKAVGSPVYGDPTFSISQRLTGTYAQAARQVDYAHVANDTDSIGYYWDLDTGVFTEIIDTYLSSSGGRLRTNVAVDAKMIETNMWGPSTSSPLTPSCSSTLSSDSTNPSLLYTAAIASTSLIIVIALLFARNTRKKPKRK